MKIGIFDSGIGGLTVLKEMINMHPNAHYIYYGDTKNLPYGNKTKEELTLLAHNIIKFLLDREVDLIIIACGTISSNIYDELKNDYDIPIVDVLNPTIEYIRENQLINLGVLGTEMTIKSKTFENKLGLIKGVSCPKFVPLIESNSNLEEPSKEYLESLQGCENIILGCTHYPLALPVLSQLSKANFINMGKCLAEKLEIKGDKNLEVELYFSFINEDLESNVKQIIGNYEVNKEI